jgi:STE24 endopeptidase
VYRLDLSSETVKANAMLAGLGHTRRVLLGDTIVNGFTPDEIEVVLAHEVGHHVHRHTNKMMLAGVLTSAAGFWLCDRVVMAWAEQFEPWVTHATLPTFTLPMMMLVLTLFAMFLEPLQNMISRYFERQCDWYALQRTGNRAAYISAFRKLARLNKDDPDPNPWEVFFFHSHPSIGERLAMAERE